MNQKPASFDSQAPSYDLRAQLPESACREIARRVLAIAQTKPGDLVVEVGAGTGQIGQWFLTEPVRYLGFDLSASMLEQFRQRLASETRESDRILLVADANEQWPVQEASTRVIFSSRAIHLLKLNRLIDESFRAARTDGATLIVGRVKRPKDSLQIQMKKEMQRLLRQRNFQPREGEQTLQKLVELCCQRGAKAIEPVVVSKWTVSRTPGEAIARWDGKEGLGGNDPPASIKKEILKELTNWAKRTFGSLEQQVDWQESYVLHGVEIRAD